MLEQELSEPQAAQSNLNSARGGGMVRWTPGVPSSQLKSPSLITPVRAQRFSSATFTGTQTFGPSPEGWDGLGARTSREAVVAASPKSDSPSQVQLSEALRKC